MRDMRKLRVVSLFSGAGGMDIGFESTGLYETILAVDWEDYCIATLRHNQEQRHVISPADIAPWYSPLQDESEQNVLLDSAEVAQLDLAETPPRSLKGYYQGEADVVVGGPPCQPFSVRNRKRHRGLMDEEGRGNLVFTFMEIVGEIKPAAFLFENVMGLEKPEHGNILARLLEYAQQTLGYRTCVSRVTASEYGVAQARRRIIVVGWRGEHAFSPPEPTHGEVSLFDASTRRRYVTVRDALAGLGEPGSRHAPNNHNAPEHTEEVRKRFEGILPGKADTIRKKIRLNPDRPCPAIFSGSATGGGLSDIHPWEHRALTPRECARLQGFPDFWDFVSTRSGQIHKLVANAVPPQLAFAFARQLGLMLLEAQAELPSRGHTGRRRGSTGLGGQSPKGDGHSVAAVPDTADEAGPTATSNDPDAEVSH